jgi:hypothetical protein
MYLVRPASADSVDAVSACPGNAEGPSAALLMTEPVGGQPTAEQRSRPIGAPPTSVHQNVEVRCSHAGFGVAPATLWLIADRLAIPAGQQVSFRAPLAVRPFYPR